MTIGSRISLGFGALVLMLAAVGFIGWSALNSFNNGVSFTQQLQEVGRYFGNADRAVRNFINTSEDFYLDEADRYLLQAINRQGQIEVATDDARAQNKILEDGLKLYQEKVTTIRELSQQNSNARQAMLQSSTKISEDASSLVEAENDLFRKSLNNLTAANKIRLTAKGLKDESEKLLRATLAARVAQTEYIETNLPSAGEKTADSIKDMFLSALRLKKLSSGQPVETAAASVASHVAKYRQAFASLSTAISEGQTTYEIEQNLISESGKVSTFTQAFAKNISNKADSADQIAVIAQNAIEDASFQLSLTMHVVAEVERAKTAQTSFQYNGDAAEAEKAKSSINSILVSGEKLAALAKNTAGSELISSMVTGARSYLTQFEEYAVARQSYSNVRDELFGLQEDLTMRTNLAILTEVNLLEELFESSSMLIIAVAIGSIITGIAFAFLIARSITRPVGAMTGVMQELADGNLDVDVPGSDRKDEIAAMARTVQVFKDNSLRVRQLQADQKALEDKQKDEQKKARLELADGFETSVSHIVQSVSAAATELQATAEGMSHSADQATRQSDTVAGSAEQAAGNVNTVAAAAEELSSSIAEISRQVTESSNMIEQATREADETDAKVKQLDAAAEKIGAVVALITDIAEQTNLLALNATIEAARAGDAGKGFAVVANEVKNLASQTGKATEEISQQIAAIQSETRDTVDAIARIASMVQRVNEVGSTIAAAVEEQGAATQEIARNTQEAATGTTTVTESIGAVSQAIGETGIASTSVLTAASDLSTQSEKLNSEINRFLAQVRSD